MGVLRPTIVGRSSLAVVVDPDDGERTAFAMEPLQCLGNRLDHRLPSHSRAVDVVDFQLVFCAIEQPRDQGLDDQVGEFMRLLDHPGRLVVDADVQDALQQLAVVEARGLRRFREVLAGRQVVVDVRLDHVGPAFGVQAQVDARVP